MPGDVTDFYRNLDSSDTTTRTLMGSMTFPNAADISLWGWTNPGYVPKEWNTQRNGSGTSYALGASLSVQTSYFLIWEADTTYTTTATELTSIADAIRTKGGTQAALTYPAGFISAINDIPTGGGGGQEDGLVMRSLSEYTNSTATTVGSCAFYLWQNLVSVTFTAATTISLQAFAGCSALARVSFPAATQLGDWAFASCTGLLQVNFPAVTSIGTYAFTSCSNLAQVSLPSATSVDSCAFYRCSALSQISLPAVLTVKDSAFALCKSLASVSFPLLTGVGASAFYACASLTDIYFPALKTIASGAFVQCSALRTASFPALSYIGSRAFVSCYNLISLYLLGSSRVGLYNASAFNSTPIGGYSASAGRYGSIYVPASLYSSYLAYAGWSNLSSRFVSV